RMSLFDMCQQKRWALIWVCSNGSQSYNMPIYGCVSPLKKYIFFMHSLKAMAHIRVCVLYADCIRFCANQFCLLQHSIFHFFLAQKRRTWPDAEECEQHIFFLVSYI